MENPYAPPSASPLVETPQPGIGALLLRLLILFLSSIQCLGLTYYLALDPARFFGLGSGTPGRTLDMLFSYSSSLVLMVGGVLLLFSRRAALWCFVAFLPHQLYQSAQATSGFALANAALSLLLVLWFIGYTHLQDRRGLLR